MTDSAKTIFTERMMELVVFKTLNAPAEAGGFYQLMENKLINRNHAIKRMFERGISETDVRAVIDLVEVIQEYPDDVPYPSRLILGWCREQPMHVVTDYNSQESTDVVITVYKPDHSRWETLMQERL